MTVNERLLREIKSLNNQQLHEVEEYVSFLKFRSHFILPQLSNENQIAKLYRTFVKEDSNLAEEGMDDYVSG